jgi:hypothetical protein
MVLAGCGGGTPEAGGSSPTPSPTNRTFEEDIFSITTPAGWSRDDSAVEADAVQALRFFDGSGDYFIVAIDPTGSDFGADEVWRYRIKGSGFEVVEKTKCTGGAEAQCTTNDQRYDVYLLWKSGADPEKVGGHSWYFIFGSTTKATIDQAIFEQIAESIRVRA